MARKSSFDLMFANCPVAMPLSHARNVDRSA